MINMILKKPNILLPKHHILLLSHMRANTSLIGHVIGSSQEVSGYYEMHIGYYSWKSLIRQKYLYHSNHITEPVTKYYFDKVLHSEHDVSKSILNNNNTSFIFMLRNPERTVKSICKLYQRVEPEHEFATSEGAAKYYIERVTDIVNMIDEINDMKNCIYIDAECLISKTEESLTFLTDKIGLKEKLTSEYKKFELTGKEKYGDSSSRIDIGHISNISQSYDDIDVDSELIKSCKEIYFNVRSKLIDKCHYSLING